MLVDGGVRYLAFWVISGVTMMACRPAGREMLIMTFYLYVELKERLTLAVVAAPVKPMDILSAHFTLLAS